MRARLARIMQFISYGPDQPDEEFLPIPRGREEPSKRSNTRACARRVSGSQKKAREQGRSWGGARNRKSRVTRALKQEHAEGILRAIAIAELKGMPLNRFWTVNYEWAGIDDSDGTAFIGRLLALCNRYARARGGVFAAVWVREIGARNGAHVHIAMHFPSGWKLGGHQTRKWIKQAGGKYSARVSKIVPIGGRLDCARTSPRHYWANAEAMANYMVKGSEDAVAEELGLRLRKRAGRITGKRCGWTQNLGANSRKKQESKKPTEFFVQSCSSHFQNGQ